MASRASEHDRTTPQRDLGDATPPHGDELQHEGQRRSRTDEVLGQDETTDDAVQRRRFQQIDDAAERDARETVRRRERSADR